MALCLLLNASDKASQTVMRQSKRRNAAIAGMVLCYALREMIFDFNSRACVAPKDHARCT